MAKIKLATQVINARIGSANGIPVFVTAANLNEARKIHRKRTRTGGYIEARRKNADGLYETSDTPQIGDLLVVQSGACA